MKLKCLPGRLCAWVRASFDLGAHGPSLRAPSRPGPVHNLGAGHRSDAVAQTSTTGLERVLFPSLGS